MMPIKLIWLLLIISIFFSCEKAKEVDLGSGYYYIPYDDLTFTETSFGGNGIYIYEKQRAIPVIFPQIIKYEYDAHHIIAKQKFDQKETKALLQHIIFRNQLFGYDKWVTPIDEKFILDAKTPNNWLLEEHYVDSIMRMDNRVLKMSSFHESYYIIDKAEKKVIGPLNETSFRQICKQKAVRLSFE